MEYDVTVHAYSTFTVEAESLEEAQEKAIEEAELHSGQYYDWEVEDWDEEEEITLPDQEPWS